ncbi:MAG: glycosyltransferase family 4 protein, partial [Phycisphaerae bacterium]
MITTMFDGEMMTAVSRAQSKRRSILFMSRFIREKGVYELLEAFHRIYERFPDVDLIMAGDGPELSGARDWVRDRGLRQRVIFPGYVRGRDKAQLLANGDLFVLPTLHGEGCPNCLLEAMGAGMPVITSTVGGIPEVVSDPENGMLLPRPYASSLANALEEYLADRARLHNTGTVN